MTFILFILANSTQYKTLETPITHTDAMERAKPSLPYSPV